jgi:sec-independent protein translocase protein TatB
MFDFSISKLAVLALLALLVLGPEKLPKVAAQLGRWAGRARFMARNLRAQLEQEVSYDELLKEKQKAEAALRAAQQASTLQGAHTDPSVPAQVPPVTTDMHGANQASTTGVEPPQGPRA